VQELAPYAVLLVEDNPADIYLMKIALQKCGADVRLSVVSNGCDALLFLRNEGAYAREPSPRLIILDLNLPKLDGLSVLRELRRMPAYEQTPVVIFSGAAAAVEEVRCLQAGATVYIQKPLDFFTLLAVVRDMVSKWLPLEGA
jgi:CheY-like chemotaxis protein